MVETTSLFNEDKERETIIDIYFDLFLELTKDISQESVLRGNILLNKLFSESARATKDLDFDILSKELYIEVVAPRLKIFAEDCVALGIASSYDLSEIRENNIGGIKISDSTGKLVYSVDISCSNKLHGGEASYSFSGSAILGSSIDKILADKISTTIGEHRLRRLKDFYDIYLILTSRVRYSLEIIRELMIDNLGSEEYNRLLMNFPFTEEDVKKLTQAWDKLKLSNAMNIAIKKPDFSEVYNYATRLYANLKVLK